MRETRCDLTAETVRAKFFYDPDLGELYRRLSRGKLKKVYPTAPGKGRKRKYHQVGIGRGLYLVHRVIWLYMIGDWPVNLIDHVDCDPSNNRWENLREATASQNGGNQRLRKGTLHGLKGIALIKGRWVARIKDRHIGCYDTKEEAHAAYVKAAELHYGEFARAA